jgi:hypothetical protein
MRGGCGTYRNTPPPPPPVLKIVNDAVWRKIRKRLRESAKNVKEKREERKWKMEVNREIYT